VRGAGRRRRDDISGIACVIHLADAGHRRNDSRCYPKAGDGTATRRFPGAASQCVYRRFAHVVVFRVTLEWIGEQPPRRWWHFGLFWLALTLAFEVGLGRATGLSWDRIASDFDPRLGGLLGFGMLVIVAAPRILAERRGLVLGR